MESERPLLEIVEESVYRPYLDSLFDSLIDQSKWCPLMRQFIQKLKKPVWEIWYESYEHADFALIQGGMDIINLFMNPTRKDDLLAHIQQSVRGRLFAYPTSVEQMEALAASKGICFGDFMRTITVNAKAYESGKNGYNGYWKIHKTTGHVLYHYMQAGFADYVNVNLLFDWWNDFFRPLELVPFYFAPEVHKTDYTYMYLAIAEGHNLSLCLNIKEGSITNPQLSFDYVEEDGDERRTEIIGFNDSVLDADENMAIRLADQRDMFGVVFAAQRKLFIDDILETL